MTHISFSVDIYSIAFLSFKKLDDKVPRLDNENDQPLIGRRDLLTSWYKRDGAQGN